MLYFADNCLLAIKKEVKIHFLIFYNGGERGIRTPAGLPSPVGFQDRSLQPDLGISPYFINIKLNGGPDRTRTYDRPVMSREL